MEHESHIGENAEKTKTTEVDKNPLSLSPTLEEQHEEPEVSQFINVAIEVPNTIHTLDRVSLSDLIRDSELEELHKNL